MNVIFTKLSGFHLKLATFISLLNIKVYYVDLEDNHEAANLKNKGILALPISNISNINSSQLCNRNDWHYSSLENIANNYIPEKLVESQSQLYGNIEKLSKKIRIILKTQLPLVKMSKCAIFAQENPGFFIVVMNSASEFILPIKEKNLIRIFIPTLDFLFKKRKKIDTNQSYSRQNSLKFETINNENYSFNNDFVAYVTHKGLNFHNLFKKNLFYSDDKESMLHRNKMLHISYSGKSTNDFDIRWFYVDGRKNKKIDIVKSIIASFYRSVINVRRPKHLIGVVFLIITYLRFLAFKNEVSKIKNLKLAIIDYEILCPKYLLLAFESLSIQTLATQERFLRMFHNSTGSYITNYLCASIFSQKILESNESYVIKNFIPVGLYRSDYLFLRDENFEEFKFIKSAKEKNNKIIIAAGYHAQTYEHHSETDYLVSWKSHLQFLEDMLYLSNNTQNTFLIIRCADITWTNLPFFANILKQIRSSNNIMLSTNYSTSFYSYKLCSHADLLISKFTSLADECMAAKIPVLLYDYSHNRDSIISDYFDYNCPKKLCHNINEIIERTAKILSADKDFCSEHLTRIYGSYNDGKVRKRIVGWVENKIFELIHIK